MTTEAAIRLCDALRAEADVLERLAMGYTTLELLLAANESRFVSPATDEIHASLDGLGAVETARAVAAAQLAGDLGVPGDEPTLRELAAALDEETAGTLMTLGEHVSVLYARAQASAATSSALTTGRLDALRDGMAKVGTGYDAGGFGGAPEPVGPVEFDGGA